MYLHSLGLHDLKGRETCLELKLIEEHVAANVLQAPIVGKMALPVPTRVCASHESLGNELVGVGFIAPL